MQSASALSRRSSATTSGQAAARASSVAALITGRFSRRSEWKTL